MWYQQTFKLKPYNRGFHLITTEIIAAVAELKQIQIGLAHVFIHHTSASLTINENADPTVRADFERHFNVLAPENASYYRHTYEGPDDMPAHLKASILGASVSAPIKEGKLLMGTWQGIYLCEHRDHGGSRTLTVTLNGQSY